MCQNSIQNKAGRRLSHSLHLLTCLSGPCSSLIFHKILPSLPTGNHSPSCLLCPFIVLLTFCLVLNSRGSYLLVERELWDAEALCYFLLLLHPLSCTCAFYKEMPRKYFSSGNNSNPDIKRAGSGFPKHCTREKLIREHRETYHENPQKGFLVLCAFIFQGDYRFKDIIGYYRLFHLLNGFERIVNLETFRIKFHFKGRHFYPFLKFQA